MLRLNDLRYLFTLFSCLFATNLYAQNAMDQFSLEQLMQIMVKHKEIQATFVEKKYIKGVNIPVESSGELGFIAPSTIVKNTLQPQPEMLKLTGNTITMERMGKTRILQIQDYPELGTHFEGMRALLAGNADEMTRLYKVCLTGTSADWKLVLSPLQAGTALKTLSLNGSQNHVKSVEVQLEDGDYSIMQVSRKDTTQ